jgi:hypothetical protein
VAFKTSDLYKSRLNKSQLSCWKKSWRSTAAEGSLATFSRLKQKMIKYKYWLVDFLIRLLIAVYQLVQVTVYTTLVVGEVQKVPQVQIAFDNVALEFLAVANDKISVRLRALGKRALVVVLFFTLLHGHVEHLPLLPL